MSLGKKIVQNSDWMKYPGKIILIDDSLLNMPEKVFGRILTARVLVVKWAKFGCWVQLYAGTGVYRLEFSFHQLSEKAMDVKKKIYCTFVDSKKECDKYS